MDLDDGYDDWLNSSFILFAKISLFFPFNLLIEMNTMISYHMQLQREVEITESNPKAIKSFSQILFLKLSEEILNLTDLGINN